MRIIVVPVLSVKEFNGYYASGEIFQRPLSVPRAPSRSSYKLLASHSVHPEAAV
jgi:hypothetical protein